MSNCCNNNCRQGRDCPNRQVGFNWPLIGVVGACFAFWAVVGGIVWAIV